MGKAARQRPARLAEKLVAIRTALKLSQNGMVRRLGLEGRLLREDISRFERGVGGEPPLNILLRYARAISTTGRGEFLEVLIDDELDLPEEMPTDPSAVLTRIKAGTAKKITSKKPDQKRQSKTDVDGR
jgi:transcriptional regulator with XRE-family HTH domain